MNRNNIAVITCLDQENFLKDELEEEVPAKHACENNSISFFHKQGTLDQMINFLMTGSINVPLRIGFHHSCSIAKIVTTMRFLREALPGYKFKFYYRKNGSEQLQPSMAKLICFSKLSEELAMAA